MKQLSAGQTVALTLGGLLLIFITLAITHQGDTSGSVPSGTVTDTHTTWVTGESGSPVPPRK